MPQAIKTALRRAEVECVLRLIDCRIAFLQANYPGVGPTEEQLQEVVEVIKLRMRFQETLNEMNQDGC